MIIHGKKYLPEAAYNEALTIPDCWVKSPNKVGKGHGEGKYYYGSKTKLGEIFPIDTHSLNCVLLKRDLEQLMANLKIEYEKPREKYKGRNQLSAFYKERFAKVQQLPDTPIEFKIHYQAQIAGTRGYIKSESQIYDLLREICFPHICYLSIMRLVNVEDNREIVYYWKVEVNYKLLYARNRKEPYAERYGMGALSASARKGQATYRNKILQEFHQKCAVTGANVTSLLVASHIKPWRSSKDKERVDPNNGILLSTLYDKLFDQGYITFDTDCHMLVSSWLTKENQNCLHVSDNVKANIPLTSERESYLKYHRNFIFKGIVK